ncbi:hypothetical protein B6I21_05615 [candidate division KSB1 bacterium 4572_119]|nr:MAG: hypothetical protein B6I21_05615 [candidate division KSB1 bacterium 4572_119]
MKRFSTLLTLFVVLLLAGSVFASGVALTGIGARATALGGNFRGIADDWSAMFWNPAGLTQIEGFHFGFSTEAIMPVGTYSFVQNAAMPFGLFRDGEMENEAKTFIIPALGFVYGCEKMSFGLGVYAPFGLGADWDVLDTESYNSDFPGIDYEDALQVIAIQPTFAYKFSDRLSVGLGVSITYADILIRTPQHTPNPLIFDPNYAALKDGVLAPMGLTASTYNYVLTDKELAGDGWGFGANFGLKFDVTEDLSIGVSGVYYNDVTLDGLINATTYYAGIPAATMAQLSQTLDGLIAMQQIDEATKQAILGLYSGQKVVQATDEPGDTDLPLPMTVGVGLAYKGIDNLLVSADISWTQWSAWDVIEIKLEDGTISELVENWEDGIRMGLGAEYTLTDQITIRGGFYTEAAAPPDETFTLTIPDAGRRYGISFGGSYDFGMFTLYANYENLIIGERNITEWVYDADSQSFDNMAGDFGMTVNNIMAGLNFNF